MVPLPIGWGPTVAEKVWGELKEGGGEREVTQGDPVFRFCLLPIKATT